LSVITRGLGENQSIVIRGFNIPFVEVEWKPKEERIAIRVREPQRRKIVINVEIPLRGFTLRRVIHVVNIVGVILLPIILGATLTATLLRRIHLAGNMVGARFQRLKSKIKIRGKS